MTRDNQRNRKGEYVGKTRAPPVPNDIAFLVIEYDRKTHRCKMDEDFSSPPETKFMLEWALKDAEERYELEQD